MAEHHIYYPVNELYIELHRVDQSGKDSNVFYTLHEFKLFLSENPKILKLLKEGLDNQPEAPINKDIDLETRI